VARRQDRVRGVAQQRDRGEVARVALADRGVGEGEHDVRVAAAQQRQRVRRLGLRQRHLDASGLRFAIAFPILAAIGARTRGVPLRYPAGKGRLFALVTAAYFVIPFALMNLGGAAIPSGLAAVLFSMVSLFILALSLPVLGTSITRRQAAGVGAALAALAALIAPPDRRRRRREPARRARLARRRRHARRGLRGAQARRARDEPADDQHAADGRRLAAAAGRGAAAAITATTGGARAPLGRPRRSPDPAILRA
jgi:drug/metabolite transporter (DMT)-like permease